jgi:hypothetical protein
VYNISKRDVDIVSHRYFMSGADMQTTLSTSIAACAPEVGAVGVILDNNTTQLQDPLEASFIPRRADQETEKHQLNKALLTSCLAERPALSDPHKQSVLWMLVQHAGFDLFSAADTMERTGCGNVFAFLRLERAAMCDFLVGLSEEEITRVDRENDVILSLLIKSLLDEGHLRQDVLDAIAIDRCVNEEDVKDSLSFLPEVPAEDYRSAVFIKSTSTPRYFLDTTRRDDWKYTPIRRNVPDPSKLGRRSILTSLAAEKVPITDAMQRESTRELRALLYKTLRKVYVIENDKAK